MPNNQESSNKELSKLDVLKTLIELLRKDEEFKESIGKYTTYFILSTLVVAVAELSVGLPIITLASSPLVGAIIVVLLAEVKVWIRSRKPKTIFYLCPKEKKYIPIRWSSLPRYRKLKSCPTCGTELIKKCQQGKHYIISPDIDNPNGGPPEIDSFCPLCDSGIPEEKRRYLPKEWFNDT